jgi:DNA-binding Xre family transcriptional regulator
MATERNVRVDGWKIFCKIVDKYKHVFAFCEANGISYQTMMNITSGKTKALRSITLVKVAAALECSALELIIKQEEKVVKADKNTENLLKLIEELGLE